MKIVALTAENVKKLVAVEIKPDGNVVQITGKNGQGKTSVLDSIWWALAGATHIQTTPIRKGESEARIRLDLGEIVVTRTFKKRDDASFTTAITVENADGSRFPSPQRMLDSLLGELSFDPLAFTRMDAKQQFETLKRFVPGVDFDAIAAAQKEDYDKRTDVNRRAKEARAAAGQINVDPALADRDPVDEAALVDQLQKAADHNSEIETRKATRQRAEQDAGDLDQRGADLREQAARLIADAEEAEQKAADLRAKLAKAPALPDPVDTSKVREQIEAARATNEKIEQSKRKAAHTKAAEGAEKESKTITAAMEKREKEKRDAIAKAKLPVDGIGFGDNQILLDGLPFDQASDAEQLRASIAIAMASNPKLRVIRVRDGSLLDEDAMKLIAEMADGNDYQVWIERVDGSGKIGFVLEDGHLKADAKKEEAA